ncbi:endoprotease bli-4-like [Mytilus trossulus]|uniref:endoprotease bli-4-like n=1 Tax=Mytilus trossulus TaxID=6551 RepID=UPI0030040C5D
MVLNIRIASTSVFDTFDTTLLRRPSNLIDVYSCSFANFHTGSITYPLLQNQESALEYGTQNGRGGLGSVYVFATGNSGGSDTSLFRDSCAYDRLVTNRYVIAVAGIQHDLQKLQNGEACSAMMVAAFTADANTEKNKTLITTDVRGTTTNHFYQNSAAAPMVSGAVALALSANPALSYRDIMHLLVNTSRSDLPDNLFRSNFFRNAAGFYVSSIFGFGLLDIGTLVERSKTWINVPRRQNCTEVKHLNRPINNNSTYFVVGIHSCPATYIEHVKISLKVNHDYAGKIQWVLISPHGTKSKVIPGRGLDSIKDMDITVLTVQMWGENPIGNWKLKPTPVFDASLDQGTVESVGLVIQGYRCIGQHCPLPAEEGDGIWSGWSIWSQCTVTCGQGTQRRKRQCNDQINARSCIGENSQISSCNTECLREIQTANATNECPSMVRERCVEQCSTDSDCSGRRKNKCCFNGCGHTCEISTTFWNEWSTWSQCTVTCGQGTKMRRRRCYPSHCTGEISETLHCYREECPRDEQSDCVDSYGYCRSPFHRICETRTQRYQAYYCRRTCGLCNF